MKTSAIEPAARTLDVLVVGGTGMLGATVVPFLRTRGHRVRGHGLPGGEGLPRDLSEPCAAAASLDAFPCDAVLNLAAMADVDACERDPAVARRTNTLLPGAIARACRDRGLPLVHVSTDMVYDGEGPHPEDRVLPRNTYAASKLEGDLLVAAEGGCALRTNFFGPSRHPARRSFSDWLLDGFRHGRELTLLSDVLFSPLSMATLASFLERVLRQPPGGAILNLGSRAGMSKRDFALALAAACGVPDPPERAVRLADLRLSAARPTDMRMDVSAFETAYSTILPDLASEIGLAAKEHA